MNIIGWYDIVRYTLISQSQGPVVIPEPINFDKGNQNIYERDKNSKGFLTTKSNLLEFHGLGNDTLLTQVNDKGVAEDMLLQKEVKSDDRLDEKWRIVSKNYLDLLKLDIVEKSDGKGIAKTKVTDGGLKKLIDSKYSDEFDLVVTADDYGATIPALTTENVTLDSREIFLRSVLSVDDGTVINAAVTASDKWNAKSVPFQIDINSDKDNLSHVLGVADLSAGGSFYANLAADKLGSVFMTAVDTDKTLKLTGKVKVEVWQPNVTGSPNSARMDIVIYDGGGDTNFNRVVPLVGTGVLLPNVFGSSMEYIFDGTGDSIVTLAAGESMAIGLLSETNDGFKYSFTETSLVIEEDSSFATTNTKALTYEQVLNRLLYIITGTDNLVVSDILSTGILSEDLVTQGFWVREFPDIIKEGTEEERKIQFSIALRKIIDHLNAITPVAWWVEEINGVEYFRLEDLIYTQQNFTRITYSNTVTDNSTGAETTLYVPVSKIKRKLLSGNFYSTLEFGSSKGGDGYEEVDGLQSICGRAVFSTINKNTGKKYSRLSPFRLSDVDIELPRRRAFSIYPEEDTKYDSDKIVIRCKKFIDRFFLKKWGDASVAGPAHEQAPTGIYRVDSAYNLDFTPARLLLNHGFVVNVGLYHYSSDSDNIIFTSSNCNSSFSSKKAGEPLLVENGGATKIIMPNSQLDDPRIKPWEINCEGQVTQEIEDMMIGAESGVPNWFGLVAVDTGQQLEYFRLIKSDVNKEGKHKFVEAFINTTT